MSESTSIPKTGEERRREQNRRAEAAQAKATPAPVGPLQTEQGNTTIEAPYSTTMVTSTAVWRSPFSTLMPPETLVWEPGIRSVRVLKVRRAALPIA